MTSSLLLGFSFIMLGAVCNGTFALPHKFVKGFAWENTWGAFFLLTMVVTPAVVAALLLKGVIPTWSQTAAPYLIAPVFFGFLWGCGVIMFGIGVSLIGLSLGYSIIMGLCALLGALLPLLTQHAEQATTPGGLVVIAGICVCVLGVAVCGYAGIERDRSLAKTTAAAKPQPGRMARGLVICVLAGFFSACCNLAFSYGGVIKELSQSKFGNAPWIATLSIWILVFWGGFLASGTYAIYLLFTNATWKNFLGKQVGRNLMLASMMALLHFLTLFLYGIGAYMLGKLGTSVGWAVNMSSALIVANAMGFMTAEWRGANTKSRIVIFMGLATLILGICVLAVGNSMI